MSPSIHFRYHQIILGLAILYGLITPYSAQAQDRTPEDTRVEYTKTHTPEFHKTVCWLEKPFVALYKTAIANPEAQADFSLPGLAADSFLSPDGHIIRGLVWRAEKPQGYLLIGLGTSMLAEEIYPVFAHLGDLNLDIFIYNYRGFKNSEGETTLPGILSDMAAAATRLNTDSRYRYRFFYGLSFGGIVFSSVLHRNALPYDGVIVDSVPDRIPFLLFCPERFDPVVTLPEKCPKWLAIAGGRDSVIGNRGLHLATAIEQCGGTAITDDAFGHVFMDGEHYTAQRLTILRRFLSDRMQDRQATPPGTPRP